MLVNSKRIILTTIDQKIVQNNYNQKFTTKGTTEYPWQKNRLKINYREREYLKGSNGR